jgi:Zn-dependent peptidase ImmA (M78 family)
MVRRVGKWSGRPNLGQIEDLAVRKVAEFCRCLQAAGLSVPEIPPVPAEYIALTITELSLRGIKDLSHDGKAMAGLLDMESRELLYEEGDQAGRQNFSIAHELGHYFLHYLPAVNLAQQPTLFDSLEFPGLAPGAKLERAVQPAARFFRCSELAVTATALSSDGSEAESADDEAAEAAPAPAPPARGGRVSRRELDQPEAKAHLARLIRLKEEADRTEWEANFFARGLLMPSDLVRSLNKKYGGDVEAIAAELGVTQTALRYRLNGLKLRHDENKGLGAGYNVRPRPDDAPTQGSLF